MTYNRIVKTTTVLRIPTWYCFIDSCLRITNINSNCLSLVPSGFCKGTLSEATKKKVCPKSCGFCDSLH
ncbi:shTK domain protein [Cooperia oncophora]